MSKTLCATCGNELFLGEQRCGVCKTPAPPEVATFGQPTDSAGLPLSGADLIVRQGMARQESRRGGVGYPGEDDFDRAARLMKVERDARGNVVWDWKNALVGGIVFSIFVAIVVTYIVWRVTGATNAISRMSNR